MKQQTERTNPSPKRNPWLALVAACALASGCLPPPLFDTIDPNPGTLGSAQNATIVVLRPGRYGRVNVTNVYDDSGNILAQLKGLMWSSFEVPPGQVSLYHGFHGRKVLYSNRISGEVLPGRVYFLYAGLSGYHARFEVMRPGHAQWDERWTFMEDRDRAVLEPDANQWIAEHPEVAQGTVQEANDEWPQLSPEQQTERTLTVNDGEARR